MDHINWREVRKERQRRADAGDELLKWGYTEDEGDFAAHFGEGTKPQRLPYEEMSSPATDADLGRFLSQSALALLREMQENEYADDLARQAQAIPAPHESLKESQTGFAKLRDRLLSQVLSGTTLSPTSESGVTPSRPRQSGYGVLYRRPHRGHTEYSNIPE